MGNRCGTKSCAIQSTYDDCGGCHLMKQVSSAVTAQVWQLCDSWCRSRRRCVQFPWRSAQPCLGADVGSVGQGPFQGNIRAGRAQESAVSGELSGRRPHACTLRAQQGTRHTKHEQPTTRNRQRAADNARQRTVIETLQLTRCSRYRDVQWTPCNMRLTTCHREHARCMYERTSSMQDTTPNMH
jgi:hypothetical protein